MFIDIINAAVKIIDHITAASLVESNRSGAAAASKRQKKAKHNTGIGKNPKMEKDESPGEKRADPPDQSDICRRIRDAIGQNFDTWTTQFPSVKLVLPCRLTDSADSSFFVAVYTDGPGDVRLFPSSIDVDGVGTVSTRRYPMRRPSSMRRVRLGDPTADSSEDEIERAKTAIRVHSPSLFRRVNVRGVTAGFRADGSVCLFVYVHHIGVVQGMDEPLPTSLDGFDIIENESTWSLLWGLPADTRNCVRPLRAGLQFMSATIKPSSFGTETNNDHQYGTIGTFVASGDARYILTCGHVMGSDKTADLTRSLYQPDFREGARIFDGYDYDGKGPIDLCTPGDENATTIDAVLIPIDPATCQPGLAISDDTWKYLPPNLYGVFKEPGFTQPLQLSSAPFDVNGKWYGLPYVFKVGAFSQVTFGYLKGFPLELSLGNGVILHNQIIIDTLPSLGGFALKGDSGSLVYAMDGGIAKPLGLVVAGEEEYEICVTPIGAILAQASAMGVEDPVIFT